MKVLAAILNRVNGLVVLSGDNGTREIIFMASHAVVQSLLKVLQKTNIGGGITFRVELGEDTYTLKADRAKDVEMFSVALLERQK